MIYREQIQKPDEGMHISIRVVVYPENGAPEITEVSASGPRTATAKFTKLVMGKVREAEGAVPEKAVREVLENLIHASYRGVVISVLDSGNKVRISDKGPGIDNKNLAMEFGFSGAAVETNGEIRGVGAGLGIARAEIEKVGGTLEIEDNLGGGTVVTISVPAERELQSTEAKSTPTPARRYPDGVPRMNISERQQKVLITVLEGGEIGPSTVAEKLEISVSTAYRDLSALEENGLAASAESGKRVITPMGRDLVEAIVSSWVK